VKANIAKLCYAVAKMTINLNSPIVISVQTNATKSRYVGAKTMTKLLNLVGVSVNTNATTSRYVGTKMHTKLIYISVKTYIAHLNYVVAKITSNFNYKTFAVVENS
jgi:hypothetical protein